METIQIKLEAFEGPMDLLLHLITKNEIDIYDIPIALLADQYMEYLQAFSHQTMDSLSAFLVMATTLLEIKSKMLLPGSIKNSEDEEEDPREELVNRLVEYKRFKMAALLLHDKTEGAMAVYKTPDENIRSLFEYKPSLDELLSDITLERLLVIFHDTIHRKELKTDVIRSGFKSIPKDLYTVEDKMAYMLDMLTIHKQIFFSDLMRQTIRKVVKAEQVVMFLALLELIKIKKIQANQTAAFKDIHITLCPQELA